MQDYYKKTDGAGRYNYKKYTVPACGCSLAKLISPIFCHKYRDNHWYFLVPCPVLLQTHSLTILSQNIHPASLVSLPGRCCHNSAKYRFHFPSFHMRNIVPPAHSSYIHLSKNPSKNLHYYSMITSFTTLKHTFIYAIAECGPLMESHSVFCCFSNCRFD